jgi:hypothetical protein
MTPRHRVVVARRWLRDIDRPLTRIVGLRDWRARARVRSERVATASELIARGLADRQAAGETLRPWFFGGPGSEGELIAGEALRAAAAKSEPDSLPILAAIVVDAAFEPQLDVDDVLHRISDPRRGQ